MPQTKETDDKCRISSLNTNKALKWVVEEDTASSRQVIGVLRAKMQAQKADSFASIFAVTDLLLLREARPKLVC